MEINKNDIYTVKIDDMSTDGSGIGHIMPDGFTLFIKDALIGDTVEARIIKLKKNYGYARLISITEPSPSRADPRCPAARQCGGCQLQHLSYEAQLEFKENMVRNLLGHIGGLQVPQMLPIIGMDEPWHYRNKAQFPVGTDRNGRIVMGFYAGRTHDIIDAGCDCAIQSPVNTDILAACRGWMEKYGISAYDEKSGRGLVRHILTRVGFATGQIMVCIIINGKRLPFSGELAELLKKIDGMKSICISPNMKRGNVILGDSVKTLWGQDYITDYIGSVQYRISALSFYQVNPLQTRKLYETALKFADPGENDVVWDLYCGIGTISLFFAGKAKEVYGVEIVPQAIADARENARINGITNAHFIVGKAEDIVPAGTDGTGLAQLPDIIVVDPPRRGCGRSLLEYIIQIRPSRVVYVSCNPATLARDLKIMSEGGYIPEKLQCVDMFAQSVHVETVVLMSRVRD